MATVDIIIRMIDQTGGVSNKTVANLKGMATTLATVTAAAAAVGIAIKKAFDLGKEGAMLEFTATKFDRLSESIGTTSEALMKDLKQATGGIYSDMELMASTTDLVGLGLAKTHDEAVRLAKVSGGLNMNMNQLVLTLTNMTTMRFDALGVSTDGFKEKIAALEKQGYSTNDAFKEAFLQQAEMQLEKVGNAADTSAGAFMRLEAHIKNVGDESKRSFSAAMAPAIDNYMDQVDKASKRTEVLSKVTNLTSEQIRRASMSSADFAQNLDNLVNEYIRAENYGLAWEKALGLTNQTITEAAVNVEALSKANEQQLDTAIRLTEMNSDYAKSQQDIKDEVAELMVEKSKLYEWEVDDIETIKGKIDELDAEYSENAEKHKKRTDAILLDMTLEKIAMLDGVAGFNAAEMEKALAVAQTMGAVEEAALRETLAFDAVSTAVANGTVKIQDMQRIIEYMTQNEWTVEVAVRVNELDQLHAALTTQQSNVFNDYGTSGDRNQHAAGGTFQIPMSYGNEGFMMGGGDSASGGEQLKIIPRGRGNSEERMIALLEQIASKPTITAYALSQAVRDAITRVSK